MTYAASPLVTQPVASLESPSISANSRWRDSLWQFDNPTAGQQPQASSIDWRIELPDGSELTDPAWCDLLESLRQLVWLLHTAPVGGRPYQAGSMRGLNAGLSALVRWMVSDGLTSFSEIDGEASWAFVDHLRFDYEGGADNLQRRNTFSTVNRNLILLQLIYRQRAQLAKAGIEPMREAPYDGHTPHYVAVNAFGLTRPGHLERIPAEVAVPTMAQAHRMLGVPADDVMELQGLYLDAYAKGGPGNYLGDGSGPQSRRRATRRTMLNFTFSVIEGEGESWQGPIRVYTRTDIDGRQCEIQPFQSLRRLIGAVVGACVTALQSGTGLRGNEIASLQAAADSADDPPCLERRLSTDGLTELFYVLGVEGKSSKQRDDWIVGCRPVGSEWIPPPVRALRVLQRLLHPWRVLGGSTDLIVTFSEPKGLPKQPSSVGRVTTAWLTQTQKNFVKDFVDLSHLSGALMKQYVVDRGIRGHKWRRTFAEFVIAVDQRLLAPLSQHFKHLSVAMTEQGYIGNDPELHATFNEVATAKAAQFFARVSLGTSRLAGLGSKLLERFKDELAKAFSAESMSQRLAKARLFVVEHDVRIWHAPHGKCLLRLDPIKARCHELGGTTSWSATAPNFAMRSTSVCAACSCFVVDPEHRSYWVARKDEYELLLAAPGLDDGMRRVATARRNQAAAFVQVLGKRTREAREE